MDQNEPATDTQLICGATEDNGPARHITTGLELRRNGWDSGRCASHNSISEIGNGKLTRGLPLTCQPTIFIMAVAEDHLRDAANLTVSGNTGSRVESHALGRCRGVESRWQVNFVAVDSLQRLQRFRRCRHRYVDRKALGM